MPVHVHAPINFFLENQFKHVVLGKPSLFHVSIAMKTLLEPSATAVTPLHLVTVFSLYYGNTNESYAGESIHVHVAFFKVLPSFYDSL